MLGNIVVRFMNAILNIVGVLVIIVATIGGGVIAFQGDVDPILGAIVGFVVGFLFMVITCGIAFLVLEINNNLIRIKDALESKTCTPEKVKEAQQASSPDQTPSSPDFLNDITEILKIKPELELYFNAATHLYTSDRGYFNSMRDSYQGRSEKWLINILENPKKIAPQFYGLLLIEAHRRKINLEEIELALPAK